MDQMAIENCSIVSAKESLPEFGINYRQAGFLPSIILPDIYRGKSGKVFYPEYTQEAKALHTGHWIALQMGNCRARSMLRNISEACIGGTSAREHMPVP